MLKKVASNPKKFHTWRQYYFGNKTDGKKPQNYFEH